MAKTSSAMILDSWSLLATHALATHDSTPQTRLIFLKALTGTKEANSLPSSFSSATTTTPSSSSKSLDFTPADWTTELGVPYDTARRESLEAEVRNAKAAEERKKAKHRLEREHKASRGVYQEGDEELEEEFGKKPSMTPMTGSGKGKGEGTAVTRSGGRGGRGKSVGGSRIAATQRVTGSSGARDRRDEQGGGGGKGRRK